MTNIVAIAGSPSHPSRSYAVLEYASRILDTERISSTLISVRDLNAEALLFADFAHPDITNITALVEQADALIIATPVYKAAYTGVLKALLDLFPQTALTGKPILPIATGGTIAHLLSIDYAFKPLLSALGARNILAGVYIVDSQLSRSDNGSYEFVDEEIENRLRNSVQELIALVRPTASIAVTNR